MRSNRNFHKPTRGGVASVLGLLLLSLVTSGVRAGPKCAQSAFPVTVGGTGAEEVTCFLYDKTSELMIVGGVTRSDDFGPSAAPTGFLYALDDSGDIVWGNHYQDKTNPVTHITGCKLSTDQSELVVLGRTSGQVEMIILDPLTGKAKNLYALGLQDADESSLNSLETFGAIFLDKSDPLDGRAYLYVSFLLNNKI